MRNCPVCNTHKRELLYSSGFKTPDSWPLPETIHWYKCLDCGMLYGDGNFTQEMLNEYYVKYYGYGINSSDVKERLESIAAEIGVKYPTTTRFVDFGGSGDDGKSLCVERLKAIGFTDAYNVNAGEEIPKCDILLASHVIEHVYDMNETMDKIISSLDKDGLLIIDGPDSTGLVLEWKMPMLDFHTKHVNHFRLVDYLRMIEGYGFELVDLVKYKDIRSSQIAACYRMYFRKFNTAYESINHIKGNVQKAIDKLNKIDYPVNLWGCGDIAWHLLSNVKLDVLDYIDNDPAMVGSTIDGHPIVTLPTNGKPIVIVAQGQRSRLIEKIKELGLKNEVIEI